MKPAHKGVDALVPPAFDTRWGPLEFVMMISSSLPAALTFLEGYSDLQESIDSPAATAAKKAFASLSAGDVPALLGNLQLAGFYAHGTHVAGIALRGNPAARLVVGRITFDYKLIPTPPTEELERRNAADYQAYVDYFRAHHVRVVNMSWAGTPANDETALEKNNIGKDATERKAMAQKLFQPDSCCRTCSPSVPSIKPAMKRRSPATEKPCWLMPMVITWKATYRAVENCAYRAPRKPHRTSPTWPQS